MIDTIHKLSEFFKTSHFPFFLFAGLLSTKMIIEKRKEDEIPGDNFPHVFIK